VAKEFMQAMLNGMFVLALPALVIVSGIAIVAYRRRHGSTQD
jgi:hypothetical protein